MNIAFKEWAVVDDALGTGEQSILIRKGGIHERHGRFEVEHREFLIYPTYEHQRPEALKEAYRSRCRDDRTNPNRITIQHFARVEEVLHAASETSIPDWNTFHIYTAELIRERFRYKPERPLFVLIARVFRLALPSIIIETPTYTGCRSWVTLNEDIDISGAMPVLSDVNFGETANGIRATIRIE